MNHKTCAIIGAGRVGSSVGFLLKRAGYAVTAVAARSLASAEKASAYIGAGKPATDVAKAASQADIVFIKRRTVRSGTSATGSHQVAG
jgi:predicted dinucleotide-binding enzyme